MKRTYWPNCAVCNYMKKHPDFKYRVLQSTYFNPRGTETLMDVVYKYEAGFKPNHMYAHLKRHQTADVEKAKTGTLITIPPAPAMAAIEGEVVSTKEHEMGLDEFISEGRRMLASGGLKVTSQTYLTAIKIKVEAEAKTKDRRADMMKAFMGKASPSGTKT